MWQRFTERSRKVVFFAQEEAGRRGETLVSPAHLLLGLVHEDDSVAARIFGRMGISTELVRAEVEPLFPVGNEMANVDMQLTLEAKRVIDRAYEEASALSNNYIGTEHLLLALIRDDGPAGKILAKLGVVIDAARSHVQAVQDGSSKVSTAAPVSVPTVPAFYAHNAFVKALWPYFTEQSRAIVFYAQEEAACRGESHITSVHLLRALISETNSMAICTLTRVGISLNDIRSKLQEDSLPGSDRTYKEIQLAQDAMKCVGGAYDEAQQLGQDFIGAEHILLGLARDVGTAGSILASLGADLDTLHSAVRIQRKEPIGRVEQEKPSLIGDRLDFWVHFTGRARKVVSYAQEAAVRLGENYVSTEHLLLGLVRENDSVAARILDRIGVSLGRIRSEIERQVAHGDGRLGQDMQLTPRAKRVIDLAYDESRQLNNNYIGTEHLLLGLIREGEGVAGRVLSKLGVDLERTRREVSHLQDRGQDGTHVPKRPASTKDLQAAKLERDSVLKELNELPNNSSYEKPRELQLRLRELYKRIEALSRAGAGVRWNRFPSGINVNRLIADAAASSENTGQDSPSSESLLIALFAAEDGRAMDVLNACEITLDMVAKAIAGLA